MTIHTDYDFDVFLSHNSADKELVRHVAEQLRDAGLKVWLDDWIIGFGDDIYLAVESGLQKSRSLALFISQDALNSDWVALERSTALFRDPKNKTRRFVPILIDDSKLPDTIHRYRYLDFRKNVDHGISQLIGVCRALTDGLVVESKADVINDYRMSHIAKYASMTDGRNLVSLKAVDNSGTTVDATKEINRWVKSPHSARLAILGDPGSGKTFLLRQLCRHLSEDAALLPVFVNAGQLRHLRPSTRRELLVLSDPPVPNDAILDRENVVIIIDGLDELIGPTPRDQTEYIETLDAVRKIIPSRARLIVSCRSTTFEATSNAVAEVLCTRDETVQARDATDSAIETALGIGNDRKLELLEIKELTEGQAKTYLVNNVGRNAANDHTAAYVLANLPRVPVILRFLQLALPKLQGSSGKIDLDQLYLIAIQAWLLRDTAFADQDLDDVWREIRSNRSFGSLQITKKHYLDRLAHAGLATRTPRGDYTWSHFSINEFFFANSLFNEICSFEALILSRLDLIGGYNINRFLLPMCRRTLRSPVYTEPARPVTRDAYEDFLIATGWRRNSGYGIHPKYVARDGIGFISGIRDLEPEPYASPEKGNRKELVCGLSWYDAFAYCLWSGDSMPDSRQFGCDSSILSGRWYWCSDWVDERKAHVAVAANDTVSSELRIGGVNPDVRHSQIGLATVKAAMKNKT